MELKLNRMPTAKELAIIAQYVFKQHLNYKCPENPPGSGNFKCDLPEDAEGKGDEGSGKNTEYYGGTGGTKVKGSAAVKDTLKTTIDRINSTPGIFEGNKGMAAALTQEASAYLEKTPNPSEAEMKKHLDTIIDRVERSDSDSYFSGNEGMRATLLKEARQGIPGKSYKSEESSSGMDTSKLSGDKYTPGKSFKAKDIAIANKELRDVAYAALGENKSIRSPQPNDTPEEKKKWGEFVERVDKMIPKGSIDAVHQRILEDMNHHGLNKALMDTGKFQEGTGYPGPVSTDEDMKKFKEFFAKPENQASWDLADKKFEEFGNKLTDDKYLFESPPKKSTSTKKRAAPKSKESEGGSLTPPKDGFKSISDYHTYVRDNVIKSLSSEIGKGRTADDLNRIVNVLDMADNGTPIPDAMRKVADTLGKEAKKLSKTGNKYDTEEAVASIKAANIYNDLADKFENEGSQFIQVASPKGIQDDINSFIGGLGVTPHQGKSVAKFGVRNDNYTGKPDIKMTVFRDEFPPGDAGKKAMEDFSSKVSAHIKEKYGNSPMIEHRRRKSNPSGRYMKDYNM
ncbi:MAG: hypothetical protein WC261_12950 [Synergistaceae bacterium]|jgi:hypothetical protein|nr:hypothetical protein [Dehalococcoidia bacterium]